MKTLHLRHGKVTLWQKEVSVGRQKVIFFERAAFHICSVAYYTDQQTYFCNKYTKQNQSLILFFMPLIKDSL